MPKITCIPATINQLTRLPNEVFHKRKTCGYARVSTDHDEQFTSYEAQIDYYTKYILSHSEWEFVKVYTDEGISGTSIKRRDGFNEMIKDALDGKIDLIITKSVSRFARNTVDSLTTIRKLKEHGVEVFFEKENIWTFDSKGELMLTLMSSLAQEESRSISENITWSKRKQAAEGKFNISTNHFIGFDKDENGNLIVNEKEAKVIRRIFRMYLQGHTVKHIAEVLTELKIPTPTGGDTWRPQTITHMLQNEKYKGDVITQKTYTVDFLTKKVKKNRGEVPMYYVEGAHEAIIKPAEWDLVQQEMKRRKNMKTRYSGSKFLCSKIICAECGSFYGPKVWHSNSEKYKKVVWRCNEKYKNSSHCSTSNVTEDEVLSKFVQAYNIAFKDKKDVIEHTCLGLTFILNTAELEKERGLINQKIADIEVLIRNLIHTNATRALDTDEFKRRYEEYVAESDAYNEKLKSIETQINDKKDRAVQLGQFVEYLKSNPGVLTDFSEEAWTATVEILKVERDNKLTFAFKNGTEITV